jgi:hypothetical protein
MPAFFGHAGVGGWQLLRLTAIANLQTSEFQIGGGEEIDIHR